MREDLSFKLEIKSVTDEGEFEGIANVMGAKDMDDDIVDEGAFTRTLKHKKNKVHLLADHDVRQRIGIAELQEEGKILKLKGFLNLAKQKARDTLADMRFNLQHGVPLGLSIGFNIVKQKIVEGIRHIKELALWEVSVVTFASNVGSMITGVKTVVPFQDLPLADRERAWAAASARGRVQSWADAEDEPNAKFRRAFVWFDAENAENFGAFKLPIADVVEGRLVAVPRGIFAAAAAVQGARGGVDIPDADLPRVRSHLGRYFRKMDLTPPWERSASAMPALELVTGIAKDYALDEVEREKAVEAVTHLNALLNAGVPDDSLLHSSGKGTGADELGEEDAKAMAGLLTGMREYATVQ